MSTGVTKSRSPVERSYSSASSTTSSRRSGRRKRRRMKHTVMPLKKRTGRHELPCDVHRVSNLDHEEMQQSACFWVAKNIDNPSERSFKEDVFVNKDQDSSDDEMSYLDDGRQSQTSGEFRHESHSESRYEGKYVDIETRYDAEKENNAKYANEDGDQNDASYSEEKTFYGVRKGKMKDGNDLERVSPIPSPRNRSRISSFSDDGHSGFSSEGTGMHVGWTSDVGVSSGPEYSAMTDESDGEGGRKRTRRGSKEFHGYRKKTTEESEFPARKIRDKNDDEEGVVMATDVTATKTTEVESFEDNYYESKRKENVEIDREFYTKEEIESSRYTTYNGRNVPPGTNPREVFEPRVSEPRHYDPSEQVKDGDFDPPINAQGEFEPRISDPQYHEPSEHVPQGKEGFLPGAKTSTPTGHVHPSSDTELVNFRSFDVDVDRYSDRSLPLGGHKTKTQYYSVEDLIRASQETNVETNIETNVETNIETKEETNTEMNMERKVETKVKKEDSGSDGPEVPRVGEYEKYVPPRETRENEPVIRAVHADIQESQPDGIDNDQPRVVPSTYDVNTQRPLLVPRTSKDSDENMSPRDKRPDEHSGTYEDSKEFYGYRRSDVKNEYESKNKESVSPRYGKEKDSGYPMKDEDTSQQYSKERDSGRSTKDQYEHKSTVTSKVFDNQDQRREFPKDNREQPDDDRKFEESKEFYGYRQSKTGAEPRDDVRQRYNKTSGDQSKDGKWEETKEFYGFRTSKTASKENLLDEHGKDSGRQPKWEQNQEFYGYRESKTGNEFASPQDERSQTSGSTTKTRTVKESREFFGFRSFGSSENISKGGRDGQAWEESKEFFGFRRKQVVDGQGRFAEGRPQERPQSLQQRAVNGKPLYLQSADDKRREEWLKESKDVDMKDDTNRSYDKRPYEKQPYDKRPYEKQPYEKQPYEKQPYEKQPYKKQPHEKSPYDQRPYEKQPYGKQPYEKQPTEKQTPAEELPDEIITKSEEQENLMAMDDSQDFENKFEESGEFYGYRRPEELPRSAAYEQYERPKSRSENIPPASDEITTREVKSTRYTEQQTRERTEYRTSEPEIKDSRMDDVFMQPDDAPQDSRPTGEYDHTRKYDPTRKFAPAKPHESTDPNELAREKHMFNILEIPSSRKVIPLVSDTAPKMETSQTTTTTETTTTKRLHTRSQRDSLRREPRQPDSPEPEGSDVGMKMFRQRSLPRKHGHPISSDEKSKELPRKMTKKTDEPDLSQVDPDFANKFREITEKRKKKTTKTTETTTKSAAESCDKNVEELVNVFNTLEHIQKTADKKGDKTIQPGQVKKIVRGQTLGEPTEKESNLSPATSVSQKLNEIENILDSVDKNRQRGVRGKPEDRDTPPSTRQNRHTYTTRETRETREERETRETREKRKWKPRTSDDLITKQEEMSVESFLDDEQMRDEPAGNERPSRGEHAGPGEATREQPRPWTYTDSSPYRPDRRPRRYDKTRSRDDDDEIYRAQIKKSREKSWRDTRTTRKQKYDSKSDGEIEGFKSTPFGERVITPGTPVNIRLYGLNLQKINQDRAQNLNWEMFPNSEVPVDESVGRTQVQKQPFGVDQIPENKMPVDESIDRTVVTKQPFDVEQMPGDEPRTEEPTIDRSHVTPTDLPPFQNDEPQSKDLSMREQQEPLYRRQERLPRKRDAPIARLDSLDDDKVTSREVMWSPPPVSKVRPEKKPWGEIPTGERPPEEFPSEKIPQEEIPFEEYTSQDKPLEELPSESYPSEDRPYEKRPYEKRPHRRWPSDESLEDIEIPVEKIQDTAEQDEPDALVIDIEYTDDDEDDNKLAEQGTQVPGQDTLYEKNTLRSSTPKGKPRSPRLSDDIPEQDSSHMTHEESTERHESKSHESAEGVDTTIHTTRTTKTTRTETTETTVKKIRKTGSDSTLERPDNVRPMRSEPDYSTPGVDEEDFKAPITKQPDVFIEPEYLTPEHREPEPQPSDQPSLVATEFIVVNNDTGRPINLTMLGRLEENDEDYLSSQSREDLFLHTRLKMVTENKNKRTTPEDAHLLKPKTSDQDDVDNEGSLTSSDEEFETEDIPIAPEGNVTEQLLIPISGEIKENIDRKKKPRYVFPTDDSFKPQTRVDEPVFKTDQPTREDITRDSFGNVFIPRVPHEPDLEREHAATGSLPDFGSIPGFKQPVSENIGFSEKPEVVFEFGEAIKDEELEDIEIVELPLFNDFSVESIPSERTPIDEEFSKERTATPTLPQLKHEPIDENIIAEKRDKDLNIPDIPDTKPVQPVDESIEASTYDPRDVYIPDLEEVFPDIRKPSTPTLVDETITSEVREIEVELPHFTHARPSQPMDEDVIQSEPIKKQVYVPDFQEFIPETKKPVLPVDENVTSERREIQLDIPELQVAEPERRASEPITEEISADEPIKSEVYIPDFAVEFQDVSPEFPESAMTNEDGDVPESDEGKDVELPGFQNVEQEPHRNVRITESDLEDEAPSSSSDKNDLARPEDTPEKDSHEKETYEKDTYEKDTYEDETWSETHKTVRETRTTETVTVEKTIKKYVSDVPQKQDEPVSPRSPKKERPVSPQPVSLVSSFEAKDSGESSSEQSPRSEAAGRKRRSRRGNRFDNLKRSGPLVPESVVRDESPVSNARGDYLPRSDVPRVGSPIVPEREQPVSNIPDSGIPAFTPRAKTGQMRPEMYLLDSDDEDQGGDVNKPDEGVATEFCVPVKKEEISEVENVPEGDESPVDRDELSPELIDELLEKEVRGLEEDNESLGTSEAEPEVVETISKEEKERPELENMPDEAPEIDEIVLAEERLNEKDTPMEIMEEIEKSLSKDQPRFSDEEDGELPQEEEVEKAVETERSPTPDEEEIDEEISKTLDERVPRDEVLPASAREEPLEAIVPDEVPEKSGGEDLSDFEVILIEHLEKDDVSDKDDDVSEKSDHDVDEKSDDVIPKDDDVNDKGDDGDFPGGVTTEEESTVETVIVEKTHSEVTVTEITTRYPTSPQDTPSSPEEIPEEPEASPSDDDDDYVIIPIDLAKTDEIVKPSEVETVEGSPDDQPSYDELPTTNDEKPTTREDKSIPQLIITKEPKRQLTSDSESDKESSESSTTDTDDERSDSDINKGVSTDTMAAETPNQLTETVFGIVDIKYEKAENEEILIVEKTTESFVEIREIPEDDVPTSEDGPTHDDVPTLSEETPKEETSPLEQDIAVVPVDEESSTSSDEEPSEGERGPSGTSETTVETLIIEKTSTQISTTITKITASDESHDSESDSEVPITVVPEDAPTTEALPKPQDQEIPELEIDVVVVPADDKSTTSSDSESTSEKDTEVDQIPEKQEIPADDKSTASSESSSEGEEEGTKEISTVETIIVEKTQVSTTITEITTNNAPDYPTNDPNYPDYVPNYPTSAQELPTSEDIPKTEYTPTFAEYPTDEDLPTDENVPKTEMPVYESAPISDESTPISDEGEGLVYEVAPAGKSEETDGLVRGDIIDMQTNERESQTETYNVLSETTQTQTGTETRDAFSMTPTRSSSDSEIQTQIPQGSASTQTNYEEDSQWYRYTRTVEEVRESSEKVTGMSRQLSDSYTQTDSPVDDDLRVLPTNQEGTQTELDGDFSDSEVTRITRKTTTETRTESSYEEQTETRSSRSDIKNDCPVCLQSLEATNYSFIKVKDASRFVAMEEKSSQYEREETHSACFACGKEGITWEAGGYSSTMTEEQDERRSRRDGQGYSSTSMDIADGYTRGDLGYEGSRSGEGSGRSSAMRYESGEDELTREGRGYSSTTRKEWSYEKRETSEQSSTTSQEWQQDLIIESESSSEMPEGAHFSIRIDGDEKCLLYCRRTGQHSCALQKLASIIEAQRKAATSSNQAASMQAQSSGTDEESEEREEAGTSYVIGPQRCDVSVQTDGALLPADFEVFNEKDFEIYYDTQKSPRWFV